MVGINMLWMRQRNKLKNPQKLNQASKQANTKPTKTHQNNNKSPQNIETLLESIAIWTQFKYFSFLTKY